LGAWLARGGDFYGLGRGRGGLILMFVPQARKGGEKRGYVRHNCDELLFLCFSR